MAYGHLLSCSLEKSTVFDLWMPIERGHLLFVSNLKAEMLNVAWRLLFGLDGK